MIVAEETTLTGLPPRLKIGAPKVTITGGNCTMGLTVTGTVTVTSSGWASPKIREIACKTLWMAPSVPVRCSDESLMTTWKLSVSGSPDTMLVGVYTNFPVISSRTTRPCSG